MTELDLRKRVVEVAKSYLGYNEQDGSHRRIIDIYNAFEPLAVGYKVKYTDAWCATFGSVVAIQTGLTTIIPLECSCPRQIALWQKMGRWEEDDNYSPQPGDYIYYDWNDPNPSTDNTGVADHVGIVCDISGNTIRVIEGNYKDAVSYRVITRNSRYIRGYGLPDYATEVLYRMEVKTTMEYITKPKKLAIYINTEKLNKEQIKSRLKCTALINGGLFKWVSNGQLVPVCLLKVNGQVLADDGYKYHGIGWNGEKEGLTMSIEMEAFENYIACTSMVYNFQPESLIYNSDMSGARQRTAFGLMDDGRIWMYETLNPTTPEMLQQIALNSGCKYALMLDGGASTQGIFPKGKVDSSSRPVVQNYICVWSDEDAPNSIIKCPYAEPTVTLRYGMTGEGVMWLQWMLNQYGAKLTIDGDFGPATYTAVNSFQFKYGLERDGICGPATRAELKRNLPDVDSDTPIDNEICPYLEPTVNITKGSVGDGAKWVQWMLNKHGNNLEVDGVFGAKSFEALCKFQHMVHLYIDGVCGPATRLKLKERN